MHGVTGNWGWAIILVTALIKLIFYPLSQASGRSMAKMRAVAPRMKQIQETYKDDREKLGRAMMELYKREKINPLAGCLPMVVQIPVFISFYWVLLESVEMRQAPFMLWINDLSSHDPFFVLPLLMGAAMFGQFKLNPPPPDPMQAKLMQFMPLVMTGMMAWFPSGLVLYWLTNTVLSIVQQWRINQVVQTERRSPDTLKPDGRLGTLARALAYAVIPHDTIAAIASAPGRGRRRHRAAVRHRGAEHRRACCSAGCPPPRRAASRPLSRRPRRDASIRASPFISRARDRSPASTCSSSWPRRRRWCWISLMRRVLELGARAARPGEFSERAFLNGKMDIAQAEAVADLIEAGTAAAARAAVRSLQGEFSARIRELQALITDLRVHVEAAIDFPDEEIDFLSAPAIAERLTRVLEASTPSSRRRSRARCCARV